MYLVNIMVYKEDYQETKGTVISITSTLTDKLLDDVSSEYSITITSKELLDTREES